MTEERHYAKRGGWLRAAVLGADDGVLSTGALLMGVASAPHANLFLTGLAGLVAGAMSMAAGEWVSVSSQADSQKADLRRERDELQRYPEAERRELAAIYARRGLSRELALKVADELMAKDALAAHARDELGISELAKARPLQAAIASALSFSAGAAVPLLTVILSPAPIVRWTIGAACLAGLALLGWAGARLGGAHAGRAVLRVVIFGALALAVTAVVGALAGGPSA